MDIRSKFTLSSSWQVSAELTRLLRIINSSGVILDEPYSSERAQSVSLVQPAAIKDGEEPPSCYLGIDSSHLRGYCLAAVEVISGSRTAELYSSPGGDYITTVRGSLEKQEDGAKVYSVQFELPEDFSSPSLSLKLLSLQDRSKVTVKEINVIVSEDYGGAHLEMNSENVGDRKKVGLSCSAVEGELQQLLQTVGASQGTPAFLKTLASSLQMLQSKATPTATPPLGRGKSCSSTTAVGDGGSSAGLSMPTELFQMMDAFKQMRPPSPPATTPNHSSKSEEEGRASVQEEASDGERTKADMSEQAHNMLDERLSELEKRLLDYVDSKVAELEKKIMLKLETLIERREARHTTHLHRESCCGPFSIGNGVLAPAPLPEETQLD